MCVFVCERYREGERERERERVCVCADVYVLEKRSKKYHAVNVSVLKKD